MTSNSSFFDLMRENFKRRYWSAALSLLVYFFVYPVAALLFAGDALSEDSVGYLESFYGRDAALQIARAQLLDQWEKWVSAENSFIAGVLLLMAAALVFSGFRYLHSRQQTDFYHSLPVSRTRLFLAVNLNSFLIAAVPCLLMSLVSAMIIQISTGAATCVPWALGQTCLQLCFFLGFCMTALLAVLLTGNLIVGLLGFGVFLYWGPLTVANIEWMKNSFFRTAWNDPAAYDRIQQFTSPFTLCLNLSGMPAAYRALIALVLAAALFFLNLFLYRRRPSEAAEKAMAFPKTEAPIKCILAVTFGLTLGMMFHEIRSSDSWALFGLACGVILTHCIMEIIYRFDFRNLFARKLQLVLCLVVSLGIFSVFRFDLLGYDRWLPAESKVEGAAMFSTPLETNLGLFNNRIVVAGREGYHSVGQEGARSQSDMLREMRLADPSAAWSAAVRGIESLKSNDEYIHPGTVVVAWHLKGGRTVFRSYYMDLSDVRAELDQVCADPGFRAAVYPILTVKPEEIAGINYYDASGPDHVPGAGVPANAADAGSTGVPDNGDGAARIAKILTAYQKEFGTLTAETRRQEAPIGCLQFKDHEFQAAADLIRREHPSDFSDYLGTFNDIGWYPVYPSFNETLAALSSCGVTMNAALTGENVAALEIRDISPASEENALMPARREGWNPETAEEHENSRKPPMLVTDEAKIEEFLSHAVSRELPYAEPMTVFYSAANVYVLMDRTKALTPAEKGGDPEWNRETQLFCFQGDHVPGEVRDYFGPEDDEVFRSYMNTAY